MKTKTLIALTTLLAAAAPIAANAQGLDLSRYRLVDLTHSLNTKTLYWPTAKTGFQLQEVAYGDTPGGYFYSSYSFAAPEHGGTHPEDAFPVARGDHRGISCARCHSRPGPDDRGNTDCVQCHARSRWDPVHDGVRRYPTGSAAPNFCVDCHRHGTRSRR